MQALFALARAKVKLAKRRALRLPRSAPKEGDVLTQRA